MTPAEHSVIRAYRDLIEAEGHEEASAFHTEIGDMFSLWPETPVVKDVTARAAQVVAEAVSAAPTRQRIQLVRAIVEHASAFLRIADRRAA